ncbi:MAG TPA: HlyD family type I secretion periplasmic adaptor subunit [Hyphomicrobiaceae bacterium]|nr:HlyD family type I secretion periplasmic adaptor subunit [Hyphomicrobiaceae bacterium]
MMGKQTPKSADTGVPSGLADLKGGVNRAGLVALVIAATFALVVPLDSAVVAPGTIISGGNNKVLQSRTGGTVAAIHAHDGQKLHMGQSIVEIDAIGDKAELTRLKARRATLMAMRSRLEAEKASSDGNKITSLSGLKANNFHEGDSEAKPSTREGAGRIDIAMRLDSEQQREFEKGRRAVAAEIAASKARAEALRRKHTGLSERIPLLKRQVSLIERQLKAAHELVKGGHIARQQAWEIESRAITQRSALLDARVELDATDAGIREIESEIRKITNTDARQTSQQLTDVLGELDQISDQITAAETGIHEKNIVAPVAGTLVHWSVTTVGAVVKPGEVIGEIVPQGAALEIQARVDPKDIAIIHTGQSARVKVNTFDASASVPVAGEVSVVSADSSVDERTGQRYFDVRVKIKTSDLPPGVGVGMIGEVFLQGPSRTFAAYLVEPIASSLGKAFQEK